MRRWFKSVQLGVGAMVVVGVLAAMAPAASAFPGAGTDHWMNGHGITLRNVYFY